VHCARRECSASSCGFGIEQGGDHAPETPRFNPPKGTDGRSSREWRRTIKKHPVNPIHVIGLEGLYRSDKSGAGGRALEHLFATRQRLGAGDGDPAKVGGKSLINLSKSAETEKGRGSVPG
jgi:hypothetical protein